MRDLFRAWLCRTFGLVTREAHIAEACRSYQAGTRIGANLANGSARLIEAPFGSVTFFGNDNPAEGYSSACLSAASTKLSIAALARADKTSAKPSAKKPVKKSPRKTSPAKKATSKRSTR